MRLLFSVLIVGTASLPPWRITQPESEESNSVVKRRGSGVGEGSNVAVGAGVSVTGICVGSGVAVGKRGGTGVGVAAGWQAVRRRRHPRRSFFMALIKTQ
jgi:F0F1-type ATP synthase membrane subunit c/vacuolar-type H+-ATPase subunit K